MTAREAAASTVRTVISEVLNEPAEEFDDDTILAWHGWDSLAALEVLAQLENQLSITLDLRLFNAARTVGDVVALASQQKESGEVSEPASGERERASQSPGRGGSEGPSRPGDSHGGGGAGDQSEPAKKE
jgi:acyl carrier protein